MSLEEFIKNLTKEDLQRINEEFKKRENKKITYQYGKIRDTDLRKLFEIKKNINKAIFDEWFRNDITLTPDEINFLNELINENEALIQSYNEEDLKMYFISPLINKVNFKLIEDEIRGFYEETLKYSTDEFILNGTTDFLVAKGLEYSEKPYFFIQEFKKAEEYSNPRPQLLAELISAVELNNWKTIKGAYIIGAIWNFVILKKSDKHKYQYFVSQNFDSTKPEDLKGIYRNLLFVKREIIKMVKNDI